MPATRPPLRRMMWTLNRLKSGQPVTAPLLAREFGCGVRTAQRDFDFLRDSWGTPMEFDRGGGTFRLTEPTAPLPPVQLSEGELVALYFAEKVLGQYRGTPWERDLAAAFSKIQSLLPEKVRVLPDRVQSYLSFDLGPQPGGDPATFREVARAVTHGRRIRVRYRSLSSDATTDRVLDPYRIFNLQGVWYLAARDSRRKAVRDFALHRMRKVTVLDEPFTPDPAFNFKKYMSNAFAIEKGGRLANVAIRFAPRQARWIRERAWHRSARVQERIDGGCVLRMRVKLTSELRRWVLQFGEEAEVLSPVLLRREVARGLRAAASLYGGGGGEWEDASRARQLRCLSGEELGSPSLRALKQPGSSGGGASKRKSRQGP